MSILSDEELTEARELWLYGVPLRTIAPRYGLSHNQLHSRLRKKFGFNACSRVANSMARSLIRDGVDPKIALTLPQGKERYRSIKQDNVFSKERMLDFSLALEVLYHESNIEDEPEPPLLLPWCVFMMDVVISLLNKIKAERVEVQNV